MKGAGLIWFAGGVAITSAVFTASTLFLKPDTQRVMLKVRDREWIAPSEIKKWSNEEIAMQMSSAGLVKKCGATQFVAHAAPHLHSFPSVDVEVDQSSVETVNCILGDAANGEFPVTISFEAN